MSKIPATPSFPRSYVSNRTTKTMASPDVEQQLPASQPLTLDSILRHHLTLEPPASAVHEQDDIQRRDKTSTQSSPHKTVCQQFSRPTVHKSTLESDNKRRPIVLKRNSSRYQPPSPEPSDPNSEAKSVTIKRMQSNLADWDKQLENINAKKLQNEAIQQADAEKRDSRIRELSEQLAIETEAKRSAEEQRDDLDQRLTSTVDELGATKDQCSQLQSDLVQYESAYEQLSGAREQLEEQLTDTGQLLQQSESMRRRLDDNVIELQGQLAIEEQRSKFCSIM